MAGLTGFSRLILALPVLAALVPKAAIAQVRPDLVSHDRLRVCAAPADLPFSDRAKQGFENRIAEIVADELKVPLHYFWMPQGPGYVRATLGEDMCDLIVGYAADADIVDHSNPYYASTYVLVSRAGSGLDKIESLDDPRLADVRLGVIAATPPADHLLRLGLIDKARTYALLVDRRFASPAQEALHDVETGVIDAAILWGPIGAYFAGKAEQPMSVAPLKSEARPALSFRIAFGLRRNELEWRHRLNDILRKRQADIEKVLKDYGVPLVPVEAAALAPDRRKEGDVE
ncbi:quinoprotein dehydrogenase-associated putative ABC transporter substrate-binding protein [uncultured Rhodoblastus sp.]|uniref:quinoprotein dehydrogenase-associated putative ABC transporter substrate-binding protein n=1 Tax=uncultured Rhodoblastus sp. TaxID=543037 RepID=UPI0025E724BB|nr:quinoprotein dehydrogenase-associated putative ABC transporter substrate-binding protein [uncultured Rhodoblastus sp.]